jgi:cystathionine beta-lyase family protein involved in aluminum resistance
MTNVIKVERSNGSIVEYDISKKRMRYTYNAKTEHIDVIDDDVEEKLRLHLISQSERYKQHPDIFVNNVMQQTISDNTDGNKLNFCLPEGIVV